MTLSLKPEHQRFIADQMSAGRFKSAEDVVAEALDRLMDDVEPTPDDLAAIAEGLEQARRGEGVSWEQTRNSLAAKYGVDRPDAL